VKRPSAASVVRRSEEEEEDEELVEWGGTGQWDAAAMCMAQVSRETHEDDTGSLPSPTP